MKIHAMRVKAVLMMFAALFSFAALTAHADEYDDALATFKKAEDTKEFFAKAYGYALFPTIGKGGLVVGGAHGDGRVFRKGTYVGDTTVTQLSVGFQAGGQAYSEIIFFENQAAFDKFTTGNFEMSATAQATAITANVSASAGTHQGASATASADKNKAATEGTYTDSVAVFTITKGGLMYEASIAGQKFSYKPKK